MWVWLDGKYFDLPNDIYLCCAYIPHERSIFHEEKGLDSYTILAEETTAFQKKGQIIHVGDFSSRTGFSDHSPISVPFKSHRIHEVCYIPQVVQEASLQRHQTYIWNGQSVIPFESAMRERDIVAKCDQLSVDLNFIDIDTAIDRITGIIKQAADVSCEIHTSCGSNTGKIKEQPIPI